MMIRLLMAVMAAAILGAAGVVHAATYDVALDQGDELITWCGAVTVVTTFGPGAALVECTKDAPSEAGKGDGRDAAGGGLLYYIDLNTGDDVAVTCAGTLAIDVDGQTSALVCGL